MQNEIFKNINKIIERDSKSTTYKFALLRGVIDIIQENSPYLKRFSNDKVTMPTGLLIEKWLLYYYPILESATYIPQSYGTTNLAFGSQLKRIIEAYKSRGGFSAFYNDLKTKGIQGELKTDFLALLRTLQKTITTQPMKYIGGSFNDRHWSIFVYEPGKAKRQDKDIDIQYIVDNYGSFSIPYEYYEVFNFLGSFIGGQDSILFKWAEFSVNASKNNLSMENVLNEVLKSPIDSRDVAESKQIYKSILEHEGSIRCVWTGEPLKKYDIDHVIPFSIWKNNDLWNLLPSNAKINNHKRNKIPSPERIVQNKDLILHYWELINIKQPERFHKEMKVTLLGNNTSESWQTAGIEQLISSCRYLISDRGYEEWKVY